MPMTSQRDNHSQLVEGQRFTETLPVEAERTEPSIVSLQADFPLCEADFLRIKSGTPKTVTAAHTIFLTAVGLGLSVGGKYAEAVINKSQVPIPKWELYAFGGAVLLSGILYLAGFFWPNDKKTVMKDIETHFKNSPRKRQIV